jgi:hypothetical protein
MVKTISTPDYPQYDSFSHDEDLPDYPQYDSSSHDEDLPECRQSEDQCTQQKLTTKGIFPRKEVSAKRVRNC